MRKDFWSCVTKSERQICCTGYLHPALQELLKGIVVSHKAVIDFISHFTEIFGFTEHDIIGNQAPFDFDVSVKDIYTSVMTGAELVLIPKKMFSVPTMLLDYLCDKKVNTLIWAVSALVIVSSLKGLEYKIPQILRELCSVGKLCRQNS